MNLSDEQRVQQLKQELQALTLQIIEDNGSTDGYKIIDKAITTLNSIKDLNFKKKKPIIPSSDAGDLNVPDEFIGPIFGEIMNDPVILATEKECKDKGVNLPTPVKDLDEQITTVSARDRMLELLEKLSLSELSLPDQKQAAKEIHQLTKTKPTTRSIFIESGDAIMKLITPLLPFEKLDSDQSDHELQEDIVTVLFNLSILEDNKQIICVYPHVLPLLSKSLSRGNITARSNAAAALFTLSSIESNKAKIGEAYVFKPLVDLLWEDEHPSAMTDAAQAIFQLCTLPANRKIAVNNGAIKAIFHRIQDGVLVDELLSILALLAEHRPELEELEELGAVKCLVSLIHDNTIAVTKENCIVILYNLCGISRAVLREVREEEAARYTISMLADEGSPRAQMKANDLLHQFRIDAQQKSVLLPPIPEE